MYTGNNLAGELNRRQSSSILFLSYLHRNNEFFYFRNPFRPV